jgi:hypothetical protein
MLMLCVASVVAVGCGSSSGNYVVTGSPGQPAPGTTGNLTFHFVQVQGTFEAPAGTAQIRFDLFDQTGGAGTLLDSVTRPFATTITLTGVSVQVQSVRLTYYNGLGFPVGVATVNVTVVPDANSVIDAAQAVLTVPLFESLEVTPDSLSMKVGESANLSVVARFDNGDAVKVSDPAAAGVTFAVDPTKVATVSAQGAVSALQPGSATINASLQANGATRSDSVALQVSAVTPDPDPTPDPSPTPPSGGGGNPPYTAPFAARLHRDRPGPERDHQRGCPPARTLLWSA